jgi:sugar phosphate isomerase/epimerase
MTLSTLPLGYCTNVHPGRTLEEVLDGLARHTAPVGAALGKPVAAGLWLAAPVVAELLADQAKRASLRQYLEQCQMVCYTLNAFPYGDFHQRRVKENVYIPDWSDRRRPNYTIDCARILAELLPEGAEGSISTMPLAFKPAAGAPDQLGHCIENLFATARALAELEARCGKVIRLAIEPEPCCLLETTDEVQWFFQLLWGRAHDSRLADLVHRHVGVCYDVCHQAVEFEDVAASIRRLRAHQIRINKVHVTCAIELADPAGNAEGRAALADYVEERYLHQTLARSATGQILRAVDLTRELALDPPQEFRLAEAWRVHFHVPVDAERLGPLSTTRPILRQALCAIAALDYAPHLEVETYTWQVLPGGPARTDDQFNVGLARELAATHGMLADVGYATGGQ